MSLRLPLLLALVALVLSVTALGLALATRDDAPSGSDLVWCVAPGERVTESFKREYPELHMSRAACEAFEKAFG